MDRVLALVLEGELAVAADACEEAGWSLPVVPLFRHRSRGVTAWTRGTFSTRSGRRVCARAELHQVYLVTSWFDHAFCLSQSSLKTE